MRKCGIPVVGRDRPSIRPSVTFGYCTETAEDIVTFLPERRNSIILVTSRRREEDFAYNNRIDN